MLDKLIDIFGKWEPLGQAIFILIVLSMVFAALAAPFRYLAVCFRGWPPPSVRIHEEDDEAEES